MTGTAPSEHDRSRGLRLLVLGLLAVLSISQYRSSISPAPAIDFYHYWGVATARAIGPPDLGSPYAEESRYGRLLNELADSSDDVSLRQVNASRREPDLTGTPFLYGVFSFLPVDYVLALSLHRAAQLLCLAAAIGLLGACLRIPPHAILVVAGLLFLGYGPVASELRVGNTNLFQLAGLAGALAMLHAAARSPERAAFMGAVSVGLLVLLSGIKPMWALPVPALVLHLAVRHGRRACGVSLASAVAAGAGVLLLPVLTFGSLRVWADWHHATFARDPGRLLYGVEYGNFSTVRWLSLQLDTSVGVVTLVVAASLAASLAAVLLLRARQDRGSGSIAVSLRRASAAVLRSPDAALALAVVATLALTPLCWLHYLIVGLVPALWLMASPRTLAPAGVLAAVSVLMGSGVVDGVYRMLGLGPAATPLSITLSWVPLWVGTLLACGELASARLDGSGDAEESAPASPETGESVPAEVSA